MFQYFSERAIRVMMLANEEARLMGHDYVGVETILLGLIAEGTGVAAKLLRLNGVHLNDARIAAEHLIGLSSSASIEERSFSSGAFHVFQVAVEESRQDKHQGRVQTEHLLLSLIREENISEDATSMGAFKMLQNLGVEPSMLRSQLINIKQPGGETILDSPQSLPQKDEDVLAQIAELAESLSPGVKQQLAIRLLAENQNLL